MPTERSLLLPLVIGVTAAVSPASAFTMMPPASSCFKRPAASTSRHSASTTRTPSTGSSEGRAGATPAGLSASSADSEEGSEVLQPTGTIHPWYSIAPFKEAGPWANRSGAYFIDMIKANGGASVFKGHPGLAMTFLTDHANAEWFFSQPEGVLDRQDGAMFGSLKCKKDYIGESLPTLIANKEESHLPFREHAIAAFRSRVPYGQSAMTHASDTFYENLWENGMGEYTDVYDFFLQQTTHFLHEWVYGLGEEGGQPLPPFKDFVNANPTDVSVLIELELDTPVANALGKLLQLPNKPSAEQLASVDSIASTIRSSKVWAGFMDMLKDTDLDTKDLERSFMFTTNFQSAVAMAKQMRPIVATLTNNPAFLEELRKELDGQDLNFETVKGADNFPLLDSFHWEINRLWPAPSFTVKIAQTDLIVPTSCGKKYQVNKGDALCCEQALAQMDPSVFGSDAREVNPKRFLDNHDLKKKVFAYGYVDHDDVEGKQFGCVAHSIGMLDGIIKVLMGRWVQEAEWELATPAVVSADVYNAEVGPVDLSFAKVTPRKKTVKQ
ncbi:unnamed protein product [Pylaiella littoralis]